MVYHPVHDMSGKEHRETPLGWRRCVFCNVVAPELMELMCGCHSCGDSCKSAHARVYSE